MLLDPQRFRFSEDLSIWAQIGVGSLVLATLVLLYFEVRAQSKQRGWLFVSGLLGVCLLAISVLRPTRLATRGTRVPGMAVALMDASHRLELPLSSGVLHSSGESRRTEGERALKKLEQTFSKARVEVRHFNSRLLQGESDKSGEIATSDLLHALGKVAAGEGERPQSIIVMSDGRLTRPGDVRTDGWAEAVRRASGGISVHTVRLVDEPPTDRSVRKVGFTGSAVAHQPFNLDLEIGCHPQETCSEVEVVVRELLEEQDPVELVRGKAEGSEGRAELSLEVTLERAGGRVIEVELLSDTPDDVPQNDRRILPVLVRRDRLRILHVAGRPTYDVRALRMFLKSDESIDLVSFFILRTMTDQVGASQDELSLIPFPVHELFSEHLKSFDAVILQDIDAPKYGLDRYFHSIARYVIDGGGLILVGGQTGFSSGGYAGSEVGEILPVELPLSGELVTRRPFVPGYTEAGRVAPLLRALRTTMGEELPEMSGANLFGRARPGSVVLWEHPTLVPEGQSGGHPMAVLALGEVGDGRTIAISVDSTHQLRFGEVGAETGGRAYADLWSGLLGWLMRDPRFEGARVRIEGPCIVGHDQLIAIEPAPPPETKVRVTLEKLGTAISDVRVLEAVEPASDGAPRYLARGLGEGGYAARVQLGEAPPTRAVFSCESGGEAWADSRPDPKRLQRIAEVTGGASVSPDEVLELPEPASTFIAASRESTPLLPAWVWATAAALFMSAHWLLRRAVGHV